MAQSKSWCGTFFAVGTNTVGISTQVTNGRICKVNPPFHTVDPPHPSRGSTCFSWEEKNWQHFFAPHPSLCESPGCECLTWLPLLPVWQARPRRACLPPRAPSRIWLIGEGKNKEVPSGAESPSADADKNPSATDETALWGIRLSS